MVPLQCSKTFYNLHINGVETDGDVQLLVQIALATRLPILHFRHFHRRRIELGKVCLRGVANRLPMRLEPGAMSVGLKLHIFAADLRVTQLSC